MAAQLVEDGFTLNISSSTATGAINKSADGSYFEVAFDEALTIPHDSFGATLSVVGGSLWWSVANIVTGENDKLYVSGPDINDAFQEVAITIPQGLYDSKGLATAIYRELLNADYKQTPNQVITVSDDAPTQKIVITFNYDSVELDFTQPDTFRDIIGFDNAVYGPYVGTPTAVLAPNVAAFNSIEYFAVHSDIPRRGIRVNRQSTQVLAIIPITAAPRK